MHYANGRAAKIGDIVRGKGYNIKHEIIGLLMEVDPMQTQCNCQVAAVTATSQLKVLGWRNQDGSLGLPSVSYGGEEHIRATEIIATLEYGQLDAFVALDPLSGEVLPKE